MALTAFFWASLVRVAVLHHVTWSVNSLCHMIGERPYAARDKSANFWPLAIASMASRGTTRTTPTPPVPATVSAVASSTVSHPH